MVYTNSSYMSDQKPRTRAEQSRINGAKSSGPKSPETIEKCRQAALNRGRRQADRHVAIGESPAAYIRQRAAGLDTFFPRNELELSLIDEMTEFAWIGQRLRRAITADTNLRIERALDHAPEDQPFQEVVQTGVINSCGTYGSATAAELERRAIAISRARARTLANLIALQQINFSDEISSEVMKSKTSRTLGSRKGPEKIPNEPSYGTLPHTTPNTEPIPATQPKSAPNPTPFPSRARQQADVTPTQQPAPSPERINQIQPQPAISPLPPGNERQPVLNSSRRDQQIEVQRPGRSQNGQLPPPGSHPSRNGQQQIPARPTKSEAQPGHHLGPPPRVADRTDRPLQFPGGQNTQELRPIISPGKPSLQTRLRLGLQDFGHHIGSKEVPVQRRPPGSTPLPANGEDRKAS